MGGGTLLVGSFNDLVSFSPESHFKLHHRHLELKESLHMILSNLLLLGAMTWPGVPVPVA